MERRKLIVTGLAALFAAPALVRASSLMPLRGETYRVWQIRCPILPPLGPFERAYNAGISYGEYAKPWLSPDGHFYEGIWTFFGKTHNIYTDEQIAFSKREMVC